MLTTVIGSNLLLEFKLLCWVSLWVACGISDKVPWCRERPTEHGMTLLITCLKTWRVQQVRDEIWPSKAALALPEKGIVEEEDAACGAVDILLPLVCLSIVRICSLEQLLNTLSFGGVWMPLLVVETLNIRFYKLALCPAAPKWKRISVGRVCLDSLKLQYMKVLWVSCAQKGRIFYLIQIYVLFLFCFAQIGKVIIFYGIMKWTATSRLTWLLTLKSHHVLSQNLGVSCQSSSYFKVTSEQTRGILK